MHASLWPQKQFLMGQEGGKELRNQFMMIFLLHLEALILKLFSVSMFRNRIYTVVR